MTFFRSASRSPNRDAVADGLLDPVFVAPALLRDRARKVAVKFSTFCPIAPLMSSAAFLHRMRGADRCSRSHRGYIRGFGDEGAGGRSAGPPTARRTQSPAREPRE